MSKHSHSKTRIRRQHNDALMAQHREMLTDEILHGLKPVRDMSRETGIPEHRIYALAEKLGVDLAERRNRIVRKQREEAKQTLIRKIVSDMQSDRTVRNLNLSSLARRYHCNIYTIHEALSVIGHAPGDLADNKTTDKYDGGMAGALSRYWVGRVWV